MEKPISLFILGMLLISSLSSVNMFSFAAVSLNLSGVDVEKGEPLTLSVSGGTDGAVWMLEIDDPNGNAVWVAQDTFDATGAVELTIIVPTTWDDGVYTCYFKSEGTVQTKTVTFFTDTSPQPPPTPPPATNIKPVASIDGPSSGQTGESLLFDGSGSYDSDGFIASYAWTLGDGSSGSGATISHSYSTAGSYTVRLTVTDNSGASASTSKKVKIYVPAPTTEQIQNMTAQEVAELLEPTDPTNIAELLNEFNDNFSAEVLEYMNPETVVNVLINENVTQAGTLLEEMNTTKAAEVLNAAITQNATQQISSVLLVMGAENAAELLVEANAENAALLIEAMAQQDLNSAAWIVEDAIKLFINQMDPEVQAQIEEQVKNELQNLSVETLVNLFLEIANLPQTPSTVAAAFETMDLNVVLDVVSGMGAADGWSELAKVFEYLSTSTLTNIWAGMQTSERQTLSPYLSTAVIAKLPKTGSFTLTQLSITPATVGLGNVVTITVGVENTGTEASAYDVQLKINGVSEETKTVSLLALQTTTVSFTITKTNAGTYTVNIGTLNGSFKVTAPSIAVSKIELSKTSIEAGGPVTATVTLVNAGDGDGSYALALALDGVQKYSESVAVNAGQTVTKTYSLSSDATGSHTVTVGDKTATFTVAQPPPAAPDYTLVMGAGVVIMIAVVAFYFLKVKKQ